MRVNWIISTGCVPTVSDIQQACSDFYQKHKITADTVKMTYKNYSEFLASFYSVPIRCLERDKHYGLFIAIPGGMAELVLLDEADESIANGTQTFIVVENSLADREFEKVMLTPETK